MEWLDARSENAMNTIGISVVKGKGGSLEWLLMDQSNAALDNLTDICCHLMTGWPGVSGRAHHL